MSDEQDPRLAALLAELARPADEPPRALVERTLALARAELRSAHARADLRVARGSAFWRELGRLAAPAAAGLPVVVGWNLAVAWALWLALSTWLPAFAPPALAIALPVLYLLGALGWLALFWSALPVVAHQRLARRLAAVRAEIPHG